MDRRVIGSLLVLGLLALVLWQGGMLNTLVDSSECGWQVVEIEGQQFDSVEELEQAAQDRGVDFSTWEREVDFRVVDGVLNAKLSDCGASEAETSG